MAGKELKNTDVKEKLRVRLPKKPKNRKRFLVFYSLCLFLVAFALILLSYFAQERNSQRQIDEQQQQHDQYSVSAMRSISKLQEDNQALLEQVSSLEGDLAGLTEKYEDGSARLRSAEESLAALRGELSALEADKEALDKALRAQVLFWELKSLYNQRRYGDCFIILDIIEGEALKTYLSGEAGVSVSKSQREDYDNIYNDLRG